jgi:hypothetical protein
MAKRTGYVSKGQRRNISRWSRNTQRKEHRENPNLESYMQAVEHRKRVISSPQNTHEKDLRNRYLEQATIKTKCIELLVQFGEAGLTRAEAIQAIKTDYISTLVDKWRGKKSVWTSQKKKEKTEDNVE